MFEFAQTSGKGLFVCFFLRTTFFKEYIARYIIKDQPTLFDNISDIDLSMKEGKIFDGRTFFRPYSSDLAQAKHSIVISSPRLYRIERNHLVDLLVEQTHRGLEVLILTATQSEQTKYLQTKGLLVKVIPTLSLCATVIDKAMVWYGAINTLGVASEEDNAIKVTDHNLADELIEFLL